MERCQNSIWIMADGRAKLLDFPAPGIGQRNGKANSKDQVESKLAETIQAGPFLLLVANASLLGTVDHNSSAEPPELPLPIEARALLAGISEANTLEGVVVDLQRLVARTPRVTRARRVAMLAATIFFPILFASLAVGGFYMLNRVKTQHPEMHELRNVLTYLVPR